MQDLTSLTRDFGLNSKCYGQPSEGFYIFKRNLIWRKTRKEAGAEMGKTTSESSCCGFREG